MGRWGQREETGEMGLPHLGKTSGFLDGKPWWDSEPRLKELTEIFKRITGYYVGIDARGTKQKTKTTWRLGSNLGAVIQVVVVAGARAKRSGQNQDIFLNLEPKGREKRGAKNDSGLWSEKVLLSILRQARLWRNMHFRKSRARFKDGYSISLWRSQVVRPRHLLSTFLWTIHTQHFFQPLLSGWTSWLFLICPSYKKSCINILVFKLCGSKHNCCIREDLRHQQMLFK